jgi:hypothetical protein
MSSTSSYTSRCQVTDLKNGYAFTMSSLNYTLQILHISLLFTAVSTELNPQLNTPELRWIFYPLGTDGAHKAQPRYYCLAQTTQKTQLHLLLRLGACLRSRCLAMRWSSPLQYISNIPRTTQNVHHNYDITNQPLTQACTKSIHFTVIARILYILLLVFMASTISDNIVTIFCIASCSELLHFSVSPLFNGYKE